MAFTQVSLTEQELVLPTWTVDPPDKNPMFFNRESYQGASRVIYPYALNDVISDEATDHAWKVLVLENEYIKLYITPEIGGKLYYATDKTDGYNFIYKNDVVRPSNIGMLGAWVSGGIEWCVLHHHRVTTFLPVDYTTTENSDGSKTIWIGETELRQRMRWTIGITVFPGKSYFMAEVKITNPTPYTHSFLYWANVAAHTNKDYQVIFPPSVDVATFHAKNVFTHWPISTEVYNGQDFTAGVDVSWWKNSPGSNSFFAYDLKEDFMGGYDHGLDMGTVHIGDHNIVKGAKLWEWGSGPRGQATEARLTQKAGPYVEIMTGAFSDNQPDYSWIRPYEVKSFRQYWYPVKDIEGFKNANLNGALNLEKRDDRVFLGFYATRQYEHAKIIIKKDGEQVYEKNVRVSPEKAFKESVKIPGPFKESDLAVEVVNSETGEGLISYKPVERERKTTLPEPVRRPPQPKDIKTVEELYITGSRIQQFYNPTLNPMDYYREALDRDPGDIRCNTAIGNILLKNGDYNGARTYFARAIKRLTRDYTRPSTCEALYLQGLTLKALGLFDEAIDTLYRATWDYAWHSAAYLELARISSIRGDYSRALQQVEASLSANVVDNSAICLRASLQRHLKDYNGAKRTLSAILDNDPLDFRADNEAYLTAASSGDYRQAGTELDRLIRLMRNSDQNYLELATGYMNDGFLDEAENVLLRFRGNNPLIKYYLGYLSDLKKDRKKAEEYFTSASDQSTDYVFPFRLETIKVLETALIYNPEDAKAYYYLGNILYDKQPEKAISEWGKSVKCDSTLSITWRNLGWGYYHHYGDGYKAINAYEKALALNKREPVYYEELDALYEMSNAPISKRLELFEGKNNIVSKRDDAFARQIKVLTLAGEADKAVEYLKGRNFSYREGSSRVRDIIIDAHLMLGNQYLNEKKFSEALQEFLLARVPEEEAGGSRYGNRNIQVNYFIGLAYEALGKTSNAGDYFRLASGQGSAFTSYITYYQALSCLKTGNKAKADELFNKMISQGNNQINRKQEVDFFSKFGEREAENARLSDAYLLIGLGYKGLKDSLQAKENLARAVDLSASNLFAILELNDRWTN
jgi:tetratricopeptide (TPR) repeat protein